MVQLNSEAHGNITEFGFTINTSLLYNDEIVI